MTTVMRVKVCDPGAAAGGLEGGFDARSRRMIVAALWPLIGQPIRTAKHLALAVWQIGKCNHDALMQRNAARLSVFGRGERYVSSPQIDASPIKPESFADTCAGIKQKDDQWSQMIGASVDQLISLRVNQRTRSDDDWGRSKMTGEHNPRLAAWRRTAETGV